MVFHLENIFFHHWIWADENVRGIDLMDLEVLQKVSITFLDATVSNPSVLLNLSSRAILVKASLSLIGAWVVDLDHS